MGAVLQVTTIPASEENSLRFKIHDYMDDTSLKEREEFLSIAEAYIDKSLYKEASNITETWLRSHPFDADANIIRCHALLKMGNIDKVSAVLDDLETTVIELSRIYHRVGDLCLNAGLKKEAIKFYRKFVSLNPAEAKAKEVSEKINNLTSGMEDSLEGSLVGGDMTAEVERVGSDFCTATLAELYLKQGHLDLALDVLGEILKKEPENRKVADRLREVAATRDGGSGKHPAITAQDAVVVEELTRWLENIGRLKSHAS
ncbi:MAG TPA: tetratricopeptide repeat protein [Syntrophales bacterium]|nr:tetratricopeptide repeat protein [Syntrophales bacterium]